MWLVGFKSTCKNIMERLATSPVGSSKNKILFFHSLIPHDPITFKRTDLSSQSLFFQPLEFTLENYWGEMGFFVGQVAQLTRHLKQLGIYDKSLVIITGDHGHHIGKLQELYGDDFEGTQGGPWSTKAHMYNAAVLIKPPFKTGPLEISKAASSTLGLRPLVQKYLANETADLLKDFEIKGKNKVVVFKDGSFDPYQYTADHVVLEFTGNVSALAQEFKNSKDDPSHIIGRKITDVAKYLDGEWIKEPAGAWLKDKPAKLLVNTSGVEGKVYRLQLGCAGLINKQYPKQRIKVWLNNKQIGMFLLEKPGINMVELDIPANLLINGANEFKFEPLDAISPKEIGAWDNPQPLSVFLYSFQIIASGDKL
jgi:hypothetical protein